MSNYHCHSLGVVASWVGTPPSEIKLFENNIEFKLIMLSWIRGDTYMWAKGGRNEGRQKGTREHTPRGNKFHTHTHGVSNIKQLATCLSGGCRYVSIERDKMTSGCWNVSHVN